MRRELIRQISEQHPQRGWFDEGGQGAGQLVDARVKKALEIHLLKTILLGLLVMELSSNRILVRLDGAHAAPFPQHKRKPL